MSHAANKVEWCLAKAKKEHPQKHRGLVEVLANKDLAYKHLSKAEHNFKAFLSFQKSGFSDWSISAAFYCIYHCLLALLAKYGYESRNQECTIAAIEYLIEQKKLPLDDRFTDVLKQYEKVDEKHETTVIELRETLQYGIGTNVETPELQKLNQLCKEAINTTKEILPNP